MDYPFTSRVIGCTVHFMAGPETIFIPRFAGRRGAMSPIWPTDAPERARVSSTSSLRRLPDQCCPRIVAFLRLREG